MKTVIAIIALMLVMALGYAQQTEIRPSVPGNYNVNIANDTNQLVMRTYQVPGVKPENRANLFRAIIKLTEKDADGRAKVQVGVNSIGGNDVTVISITGTLVMQDSIRQTIDEINRGSSVKYSYFPAEYHYRPQYRSAVSLVAVALKEVTCIGYVYFDPEVNQLTICEDPTYIDVVKAAIKEYDIPQDQATIEVMIIETKKGTDRNLGVYWDAWKQALPTNVTGKFAGSRNAFGDLQVMSFEGLVENISPQALTQFVNYLEGTGVATVRSKTKLNIVNGRPAIFHAGKDVPFKVVTKQGTNAELENRLAFEGLELKVDSVISLKVKNLAVKAVSTSIVGMAENGAPTMSTSTVETSVCAKGEKSFMLSGLETSRSVKSTTGIPFLSRIPILKYLFSHEVSAKEDWDVSIVVHIVNP